MTRSHSRMLATGAAALFTLPVLIIITVVFPERELGAWALAAFLVGFAFIVLGFLWKGEWLWLVLLVEWCFFPFGWVAMQGYVLPPRTAYRAAPTQVLQWDTDPVDVYCNDTLVGQTPLEIDVDRLVAGLAPVESFAPSQTEIHGIPRFDSNPIEMLFDHVPQSARGKYWWSFECAGHRGTFDSISDKSLMPSSIEGSKHAEQVAFPAIRAHADALIHVLEHTGYQADEAWVKHTARYLTPLFTRLNDAAYRDPRIKPALDAAVSQAFGIRDAMSKAEAGACWARILDSVETKREFRVPSPEWYAIDLLGDRLLPFLYRSYMEERGREDMPPRFRRGIRPVYLNPEGFSVRFLPVFYAVGKLRPPELENRITYDAGLVGVPIEQLRMAYATRVSDYRRTIPSTFYLLSYADLPIFENPQNYWGLGEEFPLVYPYQSHELTRAFARAVAQSFPSVLTSPSVTETGRLWHPGSIDSLIQSSGRWALPLFERLAYLAEMRSPYLVHEFQIPPDCLNPKSPPPTRGRGEPRPFSQENGLAGAGPQPPGREPLARPRPIDWGAPEVTQSTGEMRKRYMEVEAQSRAAFTAGQGDPSNLFNTVAQYPNPGLDKALIAVFDETRKSLALPPATRNLLKALTMCNTPATLETLGRWWDDNPQIYRCVDWQHFEETTARALIIEAIAHLPRLAEPLAAWLPRLAALDDPGLMLAAVDALEAIHTPEAWAVLDKWASSAPPEIAAASMKTIEAEHEAMNKATAVIAGTIEPDALVSP